MSTVKTTNLQHPSAASPNIVLAADGTVAGLRSTQNTQTGVTYTLALTDIGSLSTFDNASPITVTLPEQATVEWPASSSTSLLTLGAGTVTLSWPAGVTVNGLASGNTSLTLATSKGGSLVRTASNVWTFIPFSGGVEAANFTDTATGTYTDGGIDYKYITFTGSGELVVDQAGFADVLIVGPGAGGGGSNVSSVDGGAGGAGQVYEANVYISAATHTATIGAGGAGGPAGSAPAGHGAPGSITTLGNDLFSIGGGGGGARNGAGGSGASGGGGGGQGAIAGGSAFGPLTGYAGVTSAGGNVGGGGGGSSATGSGATGGAGTSSSLNNSATTYGAGGTAGSLTAGGANTGDGGGSATTIGQAGAAGGSGIIIIRVVV